MRPIFGWKRVLGVIVATVVGAFATLDARVGGALGADSGGAPQAQGPFAAVKAAAARNQAQLHKYSWIATTQVSYNGDLKSTQVQSVSYGPDGNLQKNEISNTEAPQPPGLRGLLARRKAEEIKTELESATALIKSYAPPNPQQLQASAGANNMQILPAQPGEATLVFSNYNLPGDALTLTFAIEPKSIQTIDVATWLDQPSKTVQLVVQFATLPDGTDHPATITLTLPSSSLQVQVTNSNYQQVVF
jgi:hypothetical protein